MIRDVVRSGQCCDGGLRGNWALAQSTESLRRFSYRLGWIYWRMFVLQKLSWGTNMHSDAQCLQYTFGFV